jgi:uncharacterized protein (TIGR02284 family)
MTIERRDTFDSETTAAVQELIAVNIDSYKGFRQAAKQIDDEPLALLFSELADERVGQAIALQKLIMRRDEKPISEEAVTGRIHRTVMDWRDAFGDGLIRLLNQAERGEDYIKAKYETVLTRAADGAARDVLKHQYAGLQQARERMRTLRDSLTIA